MAIYTKLRTDSNRDYYRNELPYEIAGYFADYSTDTSGLIGQHIPYIKFFKDCLGANSTYDLPILRKFILFFNKDALEPSIIKKLAQYKKILELVVVEPEDRQTFCDKLKLNEGNVCLIRPDGFIEFHGESVSKVLSFFEATYLYS